MAMKKPVKNGDKRLESNYKALDAAQKSKTKSSSPSAGTRTNTAQARLDNNALASKSLDKLYKSLTPAQRAGIASLHNYKSK